MKNENEIKDLKEKLLYSAKNAANCLNDEIKKEVFDYCENYKKFLDLSKTEREATEFAVDMAKGKGFKEFKLSKKYKPGDKVYYVNRNKAVILAVIGKKDIEEGYSIIASHIDSPRIDLKPNPLTEKESIAYFKTHYYGGIKKYQWPTVPLALHGVVVKKDGTTIKFNLGESSNDPIFYISDLLPHLSKNQDAKKSNEVISGENLCAIIGSFPIGETSEAVKLAVLDELYEKYGIVEEDFLSAELTLVPALKARDVGFDRSMIASYGHDDRVCAYPALTAILEVDVPEFTCVTVLTDKEEIGSSGNTGLDTNYMYDFLCEFANGKNIRTVMKNSCCLSADVNACYDPMFADVFDKQNSSILNCGVVITKYTGARGKSATSDCSAEFMGKVRTILNENNVVWQIGELGKVDQGGGGTVAQYIAKLNIDVVDMGVPVISMHAPYELVSKLDVFNTYKGCKAFFDRKI